MSREPKPPASLKPHAVKAAAIAVSKARYLACSVTDEQLAELAVNAYKDVTRRRPKGSR